MRALPDAMPEVVAVLRAALPSLQAIYLFGSRAKEQSHEGSDTDLAVLDRAPFDPLLRFDLASRLSQVLQGEVDLVDLRRCSAVMRVQVLGGSRLLLDADPSARAAFETFALSDYARLNEERQGIIDDIRARGSIGG